MIRYAWRVLINTFGIVGAFASIYGAMVIFWPSLTKDGRVGVIIIGLFAFAFYVQNLYLMSNWRRLMRYGKGFEMINGGFAELHKLNRKENPTKDEIVEALKETCTGLSRTMTHITQSDCGVCIKIMLKGKGSEIEVITLCRDKVFSKKRKTNIIDKEEKTKHWINKNTDFKIVIDNMKTVDERYFFCNNLPDMDGYFNTSIPGSNTYEVNFRIKLIRTLVRSLIWKLKYRSTIVVPIIPDEMTKADELTGFLCVDSPRSHVFNKKYDLEIMRGMADGLYNKMINYKERIKELIN